jgi:hypothetical protein
MSIQLRLNTRYLGARWGVVLALFVGMCWEELVISSASAAAPCADSAETLRTSIEPYAEYGGRVGISLEDTKGEEVRGLGVYIGGLVTPVGPPAAYDSRDTVAAVPRVIGPASVRFVWEQGTGDTVCEGRNDYTITVLGPGKRVGDLAGPRVAGSWRITFTPLNYDGKFLAVRWSVTPSCYIGACDFRARSTSKARFVYRLKDGDQYRAGAPAGPRPQGTCQVTSYRNGRVIRRVTIRNAFLISWRSDLLVTAERRRGQLLEATRIEGVLTTTYTPTGPARARRCVGAIIETDRVFGYR